MLSSTHDPYLPELAEYTREILEISLLEGVKYCIQTRSLLVRRDFDLLLKYIEEIRLQYSIATLNEDTVRLIEPRVPSPTARLNILKEASEIGLKVGIIIAPIIPVKGWLDDLQRIFAELVDIKGIRVFGESLHVRGMNMRYLQDAGIDDMDTTLLLKTLISW